MEPRIEYTASADGTRIACYRLGGGPALLDMDPMPGHLAVSWQSESERRETERMTKQFTVVRFDRRGSGLSQRGNVKHSLDAYVADMVGVLDHFGIESTSIMSAGPSAMLGVAFAAMHPSRIDRLVLWSPIVSSEQLASRPQARAVISLLEHDYTTYTETLASMMMGWASGATARDTAAVLRAGQTQEEARDNIASQMNLDVTAMLPRVQAPTLVIYVRESPFTPIEVAQEIVAALPHGELAIAETVSPGAGEEFGYSSVVEAFLGGRPAAPADAHAHGPAREVANTAILLFADIVGSTALTERLGDSVFRERSRELQTRVRRAVQDHAGVPVQGRALGDGVLAVFASAQQAIEAALHCGTVGADLGIQLHLGIHAGDVIRDGNDVYGGAVNLAARVCELAGPDEILVSDTIRGLARTSSIGVGFEDRGEHDLKGIAEPMRLYAVRPIA